jgi:hypothetical protein
MNIGETVDLERGADIEPLFSVEEPNFALWLRSNFSASRIYGARVFKLEPGMYEVTAQVPYGKRVLIWTLDRETMLRALRNYEKRLDAGAQVLGLYA